MLVKVVSAAVDESKVIVEYFHWLLKACGYNSVSLDWRLPQPSSGSKSGRTDFVDHLLISGAIGSPDAVR
ncbi:hypothetical protein R1flu_000403 [Riccia fluitans]|uniref:Uncharacterized protein n=1 Tax=Riccia fluitans TaxID=41844 RepID=A0ABD1Y0D2_9MARC